MKRFISLFLIVFMLLSGCAERPDGSMDETECYFYQSELIPKLEYAQSEELSLAKSELFDLLRNSVDEDIVDVINNGSIDDFEKKAVEIWNDYFGGYYNAEGPACQLKTEKTSNGTMITYFNFYAGNGFKYSEGSIIGKKYGQPVVFSCTDTGIYDSTLNDIPSFSIDDLLRKLERYCKDELKMWEAKDLEGMCVPIGISKLKTGKYAVQCGAFDDERKDEYRRILITFEKLTEIDINEA